MFTKKFMRVGGNFHGGKLTPENAPDENCPPGKLPHIPPKKKRKKRKIDSRKTIS